MVTNTLARFEEKNGREATEDEIKMWVETIKEANLGATPQEVSV